MNIDYHLIIRFIPEKATTMNMQTHTQGSEPRRAEYQRSDMHTREVVDQAISAIPVVGLQRAAEFLSAMNVPHEVAVRALCYPHRRRAH